MKDSIVFCTISFFFVTLLFQCSETPRGWNRPDTFVLVPFGIFTMGSPMAETYRNLDELSHQVEVDSFYISKYELTVLEFREFILESSYLTTSATVSNSWVFTHKWEPMKDAHWENPYFPHSDDHPLTCVSWMDAIHYCNWLSEQQGLTPVYEINGEEVLWNQKALGYRLPTEAEWEYAARGGNKSSSTLYSGSNEIDEVAWSWENSGGHPHSVGLKRPNELGLYDMSGNVWEWCWDWYSPYSLQDKVNPRGPLTGEYRVERGGCWSFSAEHSRIAYRNLNTPLTSYSNTGFRLVINAE